MTDISIIQAKRISVKLDLYRKFSNALAVAVIASVAWITYEVCFVKIVVSFLVGVCMLCFMDK